MTTGTSAAPALARFEALGTTAVIAVAEPAGLQAGRAAVSRTVDEFDLACSRFRGDSELTALNQAAGRAARVSDLLLDAVVASLRAARLTDGDVDPTVGAALVALGYDRDFSLIAGDTVGLGVPGVTPRVRFAAVPGWRAVEVDPAAGTVRLTPGVMLDLGSTAKALAADRAAAAAHDAAGCGVLVSLGGDIAMAGPAPAEGWRVRVTDDHRSGPEMPGQWIALRSGGLATSSTLARSWNAGEERVHHLVDPSTGRPAAGPWRTASVAAATCLDANTASTAAIVRGAGAAAWLSGLRLPSRLVSSEGRALHLAAWPDQGEELPRLAGLDAGHRPEAA